MLCDQRARCRSPRKTPMRAHFPRRTLDSDWTARCHMRRRTSCLSCFRSRTYCSALPYSKTQVTRSPCSTPPSESAAGCVNVEPASGFDSVYARNDRRVMWPPLRQRGAPAWHPLSGCPVTQSPYYPAAARPVSPHSVASWPWRGSLDDPSRLRDSVVAAVRGVGGQSLVERSRKTAAGRAQIGTQKVGTGSVWPMKRASTFERRLEG
jgi:hypothetical protein